MGTHLRVDLAAVERIATELAILSAEFTNAGDIVAEHERAIGARVLIDALEEFAGNWERHREKLPSKMDATQAMAAQSVRYYLEVDDELTRALTGTAQP